MTFLLIPKSEKIMKKYEAIRPDKKKKKKKASRVSSAHQDLYEQSEVGILMILKLGQNKRGLCISVKNTDLIQLCYQQSKHNTNQTVNKTKIYSI